VRFFIFLAAVAATPGCVQVGQYSPEQAELVPTSRLYGFTKRSDAHRVVVRDESNASRCTIRFSIDGSPSADFHSGESAHFGVTMGEHRISALPDQGCSDLLTRNLKVAVKNGDTVILCIEKTRISSAPM
jgi:hypothetical protein